MAAPPHGRAGERRVVGGGAQRDGRRGEAVCRQRDRRVRAFAVVDRDLGQPLGVGVERVVAAMLDEEPRVERDRRRCVDQRPRHAHRARVAQHEHAALETRGTDLVGRRRDSILEPEPGDRAVSGGVDRAIGPSARGERHARRACRHLFVDERDKHAPADRGLARCDEEAVVPTRGEAVCGSERVVAEARGGEPLAARARGAVAGDAAVDLKVHRVVVRSVSGSARHEVNCADDTAAPVSVEPIAG